MFREYSHGYGIFLAHLPERILFVVHSAARYLPNLEAKPGLRNQRVVPVQFDRCSNGFDVGHFCSFAITRTRQPTDRCPSTRR